MTTDRLFVDIGALSCCASDHALEFMHKALANPVDDDGIWDPHPDLWIAGTVETFSAAGRERLGQIQNSLLEHLRAAWTMAKAFRPDAADVSAAVKTLNGKAPAEYNVTDWLSLVDWLIFHYLPQDFVYDQADYLATRAYVAGRIEAGGAARPPSDVETLLPNNRTQLVDRVVLTPTEHAMLDVANARAANAITNVGNATRSRMNRVVLNHLEQRIVRNPQATTKKLESDLSDEFGQLNRDWRRIAITETGNATNEGVIASCKPGQMVKRVEAYQGACPFCEKINGMVFTVVSADKKKKDGWKEVWPGKTNIDRSASPRKRVGNELVAREQDELWWPAAGLQHPNCRGRWVILQDKPIDPKVRKRAADLLNGIGIKPTWQHQAGDVVTRP